MEGDPDKQFKKGKEALETGIFKWSKDYTSAAMYFDKAASLYKVAARYQDVGSTGDNRVQRTDRRKHQIEE